MPVLVIAVSCLVIFGVMGILAVAAVHCERHQQVKEESDHKDASEPVAKAI